MNIPSPSVAGTSQYFCLDMVFGLWAGDGAQSRHLIGKHFLFTTGFLWGESQG